MTASCPKKPNIAEISPHLICALCGGYLIDATTIVECLHSFCKTCIVRYLESSKYCPICEVLVHKTRPLQNIRLDHTLQNIVYKLVPGLFQEEMKRRREFYKDSPTVRSSQSRQEQQRHRIIYSADEKFSVALEFCPDGRIRRPSTSRARRHSKSEAPDRRYLMCPANTTIALLKKFMKLKFFLNEKFKVDIFHADGNLRDHYQLMDVAYIYSYKREGVLQLYYSVQRSTNPEPKIEIAEVKTEGHIHNVTGSCRVENEALRAQNMDDNRPSSLFSKASLLSNHRMGGNIEHDLSPLELIATVANDLSSYQEGRCLKRKADDAELFENDEENSNSNSKEIQIQKSIEHAIDICSSSNGNHGNSNHGNGKDVKSADSNGGAPSSQNPSIKPKTAGRSGSPALASADNALKAASNKQKCLKTAPNLFDNIVAKVTKLPPKEKPKTTDTASQCEPRQKKQKTTGGGDSTVPGSIPHSTKSPIKSPLKLPSSFPAQHQKLQQQQSKPETVLKNHVTTDKSKSQDDSSQKQEKEKERAKVIVNNNNIVGHNGAISTKGIESKPRDTPTTTTSTTTNELNVKVNKMATAAPPPATVASSVTCHKTSVIRTNSDSLLKSAGVASSIPLTNGFTNSVSGAANVEKQPSVVKTKQSEKD